MRRILFGLVMVGWAGAVLSAQAPAGRGQGRGGGPKMPPMPAIVDADVTAIAEFLHSLAAVGRNRAPTPLNVLVGDVSAGRTAFASTCASCHSTAGDLKGIGTRIADPMTLQNF